MCNYRLCAVCQPDFFLHARRIHMTLMTAVITRAAVPPIAPNVRCNVLTCSEEAEGDNICVCSVTRVVTIFHIKNESPTPNV